MILITVGSQKFQFNRLLEKTDELIEKNIIKDKVYAQIGVSSYKPKNFEYIDFLTQDEFNKKLDLCDLLITHAGTGVIVNASKKGKKIIAIPRLSKYNEHVDDHQIQLIQEFANLKFVEPCYEIEKLENAYKNVNKKKYKKYISNTDMIIKNIRKFID